MAGKKKKSSNRNTSMYDVSFRTAFMQGNGITKLSALIFGLGNLLHKQIIRGFIMLSVEITYIYYMISFGL